VSYLLKDMWRYIREIKLRGGESVMPDDKVCQWSFKEFETCMADVMVRT
jgi:hypothetical protein